MELLKHIQRYFVGEAKLSGKFDIIRIDLCASEQYKSMVLAGQRPEVVLEIASRAIAFWTYQTHQEKMYQEHIGCKAKERSQQLEQYYGQLLTKVQAEHNTLTSQLKASKTEVEQLKTRYNEVQEKMMERNRQYQKLQTMYEALRRKCITPHSFDQSEGQLTHSNTPRQQFGMPLTSIKDVMRAPTSAAQLSPYGLVSPSLPQHRNPQHIITPNVPSPYGVSPRTAQREYLAMSVSPMSIGDHARAGISSAQRTMHPSRFIISPPTDRR
ncbi:PREDICTED: E3 ubiquitin-protein ligase CCNB1IP1-like [Priapulus caudatus]|uniref:E3 ubiquitin-protein ligase CCNB1IP1-like n=1 Tax=Priapulus caudatus TaxID=37621 RepID=A0ABM1EQ93_PRICU|nr:PREDICTED: E3 ubiquitin-protein ligase CCNB1IP1-like [Priapulus caudatus]